MYVEVGLTSNSIIMSKYIIERFVALKLSCLIRFGKNFSVSTMTTDTRDLLDTGEFESRSVTENVGKHVSLWKRAYNLQI